MRPRPVVVIHREAMVAEGIAAALARYPGVVPVAAASTAADGERRAQGAEAVALDDSIPGADALAASLRRRGIRVVLIGEPRGGDGGTRVPVRAPVAALARALAPEVWDGGNGHRAPASLTRRERQVLGLVAQGLAAKQVARHLGISPKTVEVHKTHIFRKLGVPNQAAAVSRAGAPALAGRDAWSLSST
jgi:DNA-binding NarL/FixJ family response regulator